MNTDQLHEVLERAASPVPRPDLGRASLAEAGRVRVRRRGIAAAGAACAVVAAVAVGTSLSGSPSVREPDPAPPPEVPPSSQAGAIPESVVQGFWDVPGVAGLPLRDSVLPDELAQPGDAPGLAGDPLPAAVLSLWGEGDVTYLLSPDGEWRSVPHPGPEPSLAELSDDGTRLAMPGSDGLEVWDLPAGTSQTLPWPDDARLPVADLVVGLEWLPDGEHVLVISGRRSWSMGTDGSVVELPYPTNPYNTAVFPAGEGRVVELAYDQRGGFGRSFVTWRGRERASSVDSTPLESLDRGVFRGDLFAAVRGDGGWSEPRLSSDHDGLVVLGADDLTARAYLPIEDDTSAYSQGALTVHGWLDDETVLAWVQPKAGPRRIGEEWYLVAWHYPSGELTRLSGGDAYARLTDVVPSLVGR